jgi:Animal haem peroxidase
VVLQDFLPTVAGKDMLFSVLPHLNSGKSILVDKPNLQFYKFRHSPFIPIEFTVAAYRFGHSMIRPIYRLNTTLGKNPPPADDPVNGRQMIFDPAGDDLSLTGFREFPSVWAIDWSLFFDMGNKAPSTGVTRLQKAYKIDTSLVSPLGALPPSVAKNPSSLAARNLLRGLRMGLPSGQDVARAMGHTPLRDDQLIIGKATEDDPPVAKSITALPKIGSQFKGKAPLWYYILAEAQQQFKKNDTPIHLGEVGGRIVTETFVGLMLGDSHSFLSQNPNWTPATKPFLMSDLIKIAIAP